MITVTRPPRWRLRRATVAVVALAMVALAAAPAVADTTERSKRVKVAGKVLVQSDKVGTTGDPALGKTVPVLSGTGFDGEKVTLKGDGTTPRLLLVLSHSCPHCQAEVPRIVKLAKQGKLDGVEVQTITTNTDERLPNYPPSRWLARERWPFTPILADDANGRGCLALGCTFYPFMVFVDAQGKVVARSGGEVPPASLAKAAKNLVAGTPVLG
jgi:thiol-disulfide isomerase/thioredoxin